MSVGPSLFIGSSMEGRDIASAIQENLEYDCEPTPWLQGVFNASSTPLVDLFDRTRRAEFAVFVFTPDDTIKMRDREHAVARDNVIFELGLFIGAIGPQRCFYVVPHGAEMHLPSDLAGVEPLRYMPHRKDGNLQAALGPACNHIRRAMRAPTETVPPAALHTHEDVPSPRELARRLISEWNSEVWLGVRTILRAGVALNIAGEFDPAASQAMTAAFHFLNSVADGVLSGQVDNAMAEDAFFEALTSMWERAFLYFVPPGGDPIEAWKPIPPIAVLAAKWATQTS